MSHLKITEMKSKNSYAQNEAFNQVTYDNNLLNSYNTWIITFEVLNNNNNNKSCIHISEKKNENINKQAENML